VGYIVKMKSVCLNAANAGGRQSLVCRASVSAGQQVRVKAPVTVYHVGKFKSGLSLEGKTGTVIGDVRQYEDQELSATLPWKVEFEVEAEDGKSVKVLAHLEDDELEQA